MREAWAFVGNWLKADAEGSYVPAEGKRRTAGADGRGAWAWIGHSVWVGNFAFRPGARSASLRARFYPK